MRNNFCFILLIVLASCSKQASHSTPFGFNMDSYITKRPFQVIFSEHTHDGGATARLSPLEYLSLGDTIQIVDSGYLVLVHYSGLFLEFKEDTIISVTELSNSIAQQLNINPNKAKSRIDIDLLFSDQGKIQYATGVSSICNPSPMEYVLPINTASEISASNPEFCVSWTSNLSTPPYIVQVKNIFDEIIDEIEVKENEINLDLSGYQNDGNLYIRNRDKNRRTV